MRRLILPKLSVKYILENVSQEQIMSHYLGVTQSEIDYCTSQNKRICAPYRDDTSPSLGFRYTNKGKLRARDFAGYFWGDCFDAAGFNLGRDPNDKNDFGHIMENIAMTFRIHKYSTEGRSQTAKFKITTVSKSKLRLRIDVEARKWCKEDVDYWYTKYTINGHVLKKFNVIPINRMWFNGSLSFEFDEYDPDIGYAYYFGKDKDGIPLYKIYFPLRDKYRFFSNNDCVQGIHYIKPAEFGIITKAFKDVICLSLFNVQAIAPSSETKILTTEQMFSLKKYWKYIYTLSDFDPAGIRFGCEMRRRYKTETLFITNGRYNTIDYGVKDFSDYIDAYGYDQAKILVDYGKRYENFDKSEIFINLINRLGHV